jgi:tripartite-type tricarboxylate transporter receptor subunit TctC
LRLKSITRAVTTAIAAAGLAGALAGAMAGPTQAQEWPSRQMTMIIPFAAGGPVDTIGRILGQYLGDALGQQIVVENVGGAGGMIGASRVAKSDPDGYTMLLGGSAVLALNQAIYKKPMVDGVKDFTMVSMFADSARLLLVRKDFPANNMKEFMAYAKANATKMQYGSAGVGSGSHVCAVLLDSVLGQKVAHVPYRGSALAMQDLIAGRLDFVAEQISTAVSHVESGSIRAISTMGAERVSVLPKLPTAEEDGFKGLDCGSWAAIVYPKGVPAAIVKKVAAAVDKVLDDPAVKARYEKIGVSVPAKNRRSPEYLEKFTPEEIERWGKAIRGAGISHD